MGGTEDIRPTTKINVGVSACLLGEPVRYNGGHTRSKLCLDTLSGYFNFLPFCPEVAAGFGTPRPAMRLKGNPNNPRLSLSDNPASDLTDQLIAGFEAKIDGFAKLDGYLLMKNSPSCGLERVKIYHDNGYVFEQRGRGIMTTAIREQFPLLPLEEEARLNDPAIYENFILRVFTHHNFRNEVAPSCRYHDLIKFHSSYKLVILAHNQKLYRALGKMLAGGKSHDYEAQKHQYLKILMQALGKPAKRTNHTNVLMHILGYLKHSVPGSARQNIVDIILRYHDGQLPLISPTTLLKHYIDQLGSDYIRSQRYLAPYPDNLGLRNKL